MNNETSEFIRHEACPSCTSSDAYAIYSNGSGYCFSCGHTRQGETRDNMRNQSSDSESNRVQQTKANTFRYEGDHSSIRSRKLNESTCIKFNVRVGDSKEGPVIRFPYYSSAGKVVAYKQRGQSKDFRWFNKNEDKQLFGQQLFGSGKTIVITEGEMDALSVYQARPNWPVVSVPNGAHSAKKALSAQLNYLMGFDEVILMFDNDDAGTTAAEECISLFPTDKVFLASLTQYKDASDAIKANDAEAIRQAVWNKRKFTPKSIIDGTTLFDLVSKPLHGKDADYPYNALNQITGGLRLGELVTTTAGSGTGKSTFCGEVCQSLVDQGFNVGYIALEESIQRTALRLMTVKANKPLHLSNEIPEKDMRKAFDASVGSGRVFLRDGFGSCDPDVVLNDIRFMVKNHNVQFIILDHLSILLSGNESNDERKTIDITMTKLRSFVEETKIGMLLISHLRRSHQDKGHEDGASISLGQLRGSHSIAQLSDIVIALQRNISSGEDHAELVTLKNRFNGSTGPSGFLSYGKDTGRLVEIDKPIETNNNDKKKVTPTDYGDF